MSTRRKHVYESTTEEDYASIAYGTTAPTSTIFYVAVLIVNMLFLTTAATFGTMTYFCNGTDVATRFKNILARQFELEVDLNATDYFVAPIVLLNKNETRYYAWPPDIEPEDAYVRRFICGKQAIAPNTSYPYTKDSIAVAHSWPWQVEIGQLASVNNAKVYKPVCGGILVSPRHVITAKTCFDMNYQYEKYYVKVGKHAQHGGDLMEACKVRIHPQHDYDVALLTLRNELQMSYKTGIICLPLLNIPPMPGSQCWNMGWNADLNNMGERYLVQSTGTVVGFQQCGLERWRVDEKKHVCVSFSDANNCPGGHGSPLICNYGGVWMLQGVTQTKDYCQAEKMAAFFKIDSILPWICCYMQTLPGCIAIPCLLGGQHVIIQ